MESKQIEWWVYLVICSDGSLYTGITTNVERRISEHNTSKKGAKYTRNKRPVRLVYSEAQSDRSTASKREYFIKKLSREEKLKLIKKGP
ncbi:GIY-YIG nuclease family protein [Flavobacteriaceae bacterium]|uniref:GIY-YIG nuclease family protein n=1 Tax=Candidatus Arcticimaribacter forsetii TaxID=2820661 RepID=UPI00207736AC|nr:GIY-YIG nuclease family protein [Candidatus Arcticimaribacter forsetii]MDA8639646.1 GIY-YIG nuclease family protein [Flavobacteriaceae bacterium]MDA8698679.1 GIY-YIG nuclease family protein [Flavobacteriaceae bacterium]MDB2329611.1 GIY-YIG nuclease family protein [Flavobacteriaceae bacterium]MDB2346027.1 GIY-YIG nuclease family protein [Flavobacteriaceae bacterium]MDB2456691.1 GIY-YIG nuclease family protein [Flavobacteriaceae bacterium]